MQDGGVLPDSGFPRDGGMANEERAKTTRTWCKHEHLIQHTYIHGRSSRRYTFETCVFGSDRVRSGVGEIDVLGTVVVEVVIHGDGSCTRSSRRGT